MSARDVAVACRSRLFAWLAVALCLLGMGGAAQAQQGTTPGKIPGEFAVSPSGAATYRIPIDVPLGFAGMEPKLALVYNSRAGNGPLGLGWSIEGLSAITRCPKTMATDGVRGAITHTHEDRFCLDGQRLINIAGPYGAAGSEYRTEIDSFHRIVVNDNVYQKDIFRRLRDRGPRSFTIINREGVKFEYGVTEDSRIEAQGKRAVRVWALNRMTDIKGNYIQYVYQEDSDGADYRIDRIEYGAGLMPPVAKLEFFWGLEQASRVLYQAGSTIQSKRYLTHVVLQSGNRGAFEYKLDYIAKHQTNCIPGAIACSAGLSSKLVEPPNLVSVKQCAVGAGLCFESKIDWRFSAEWSKVYFDSHSRVAPVNQFGVNNGWLNSNEYPRVLADVNGDGLSDIVGFASDGVYVGLNNGGSFSSQTRWGMLNEFGRNSGWVEANHPRSVIDVNGDGLPDIVGFASDGVYVALSTGKSYSSAVRWTPQNQFGTNNGWSNNNDFPRTLADVNGDSLPDIVGFASDGVYVGLNTGTSYASQVRWGAANEFGRNNGWVESIHPRSVIDVNGDDLPDIVGFASDGVYVALNNGSAFSPHTRWAPENQFGTNSGWSNNNDYPRKLADVNGDGLPDIVGFASDGVYVGLNTGASFISLVRWGAANEFGRNNGWVESVHPRSVIDISGDGLPDIVGFASDGVYVALNTGSSYSAAVRWAPQNEFGTNNGWSSNSVFPRWMVDVDGDGYPDVVGFASDGVYVGLNKQNIPKNQVSAVHGAHPISVRYSYWRNQGAAASSAPHMNLSSGGYVVSTVLRPHGVGVGAGQISYTYGGLKAEYASPRHPGSGRGTLGFAWMKVKEESTGIETTTNFSQQWPYVGQVVSSETRLGSRLLKQSIVQMDCRATAQAGAGLLSNASTGCAWQAGKVYFPFVSLSEEQSWDLNGAVMPRIRTTTSYNGVRDTAGVTRQLGDPTTVMVDIYEGNTLRHRKTTTNEYLAADVSAWSRLGRLSKASVTSSSWDTGGPVLVEAGAGASGASSGAATNSSANALINSIIMQMLMEDDEE